MTGEELRNAMAVHGDAVYRLALCRLQNTADAEDVYQDVFLRLLERGSAGWDSEHLKAWLLRTALNRCADVGRSRRRYPLPLEEAMGMSRAANEEESELWDAVARLPEKLRTAVHLFYGEGYESHEIGTLLGIPAATVRSRLSRARRELRNVLGGFEDGQSVSETDGTNSCACRVE